MTAPILIGLALVLDQGPLPDRVQLAKLIDGAQAAIGQDIGFEYEGREIVAGVPERKNQKLGPDGVRDVFTGTFARRADGATLVDVFHANQRDGRPRRGRVALLNGVAKTSSIHADEAQAKLSVRQQSPLTFAGTGSFRRAWLADWVRSLCDSSYVYKSKGYSKIDGNDCLIACFSLVLDEKDLDGKEVSHTFWIDMQKDAQVVRHEQRWGPNLVDLTSVKLGRFEPAPGRVAWIPVLARFETRLAFRDNQQKFLDEPVLVETYDLLRETLRFDRGLKDDFFSLAARPGDAVSDDLKKAQYEFGQYAVRPRMAEGRIPDSQIKADLDRMLADSRVMANELRAGSPLRDGQGWLSYWPWGLAGASILGTGMVLRRRVSGADS